MRGKQLLPILIWQSQVIIKSLKYKIIVNFHLFTLKSGYKFGYKLLKWGWRSYHLYTSTNVKRHLIYVVNIFFLKINFLKMRLLYRLTIGVILRKVFLRVEVVELFV